METLKEYLENWDKPLFENKEKLRKKAFFKACNNSVQAEIELNKLLREPIGKKFQYFSNLTERKTFYEILDKIENTLKTKNISEDLEATLIILKRVIGDIVNSFGRRAGDSFENVVDYIERAYLYFIRFKEKKFHLQDQDKAFLRKIIKPSEEKLIDKVLNILRKELPDVIKNTQEIKKLRDVTETRNKLHKRLSNLEDEIIMRQK